jgi:hypothetical protein
MSELLILTDNCENWSTFQLGSTLLNIELLREQELKEKKPKKYTQRYGRRDVPFGIMWHRVRTIESVDKIQDN